MVVYDDKKQAKDRRERRGIMCGYGVWCDSKEYKKKRHNYFHHSSSCIVDN